MVSSISNKPGMIWATTTTSRGDAQRAASAQARQIANAVRVIRETNAAPQPVNVHRTRTQMPRQPNLQRLVDLGLVSEEVAQEIDRREAGGLCQDAR